MKTGLAEENDCRDGGFHRNAPEPSPMAIGIAFAMDWRCDLPTTILPFGSARFPDDGWYGSLPQGRAVSEKAGLRWVR